MITCDLWASDVLTRVTRLRPAIAFSNTNVMVKRGDVSDFAVGVLAFESDVPDIRFTITSRWTIRQCLIARPVLYNVGLRAERRRAN